MNFIATGSIKSTKDLKSEANNRLLKSLDKKRKSSYIFDISFKIIPIANGRGRLNLFNSDQ